MKPSRKVVPFRILVRVDGNSIPRKQTIDRNIIMLNNFKTESSIFLIIN